MIGWEQVCKPLELGSLGLKKIKEFNVASLLKWMWRILKGKDELWRDVFEASYGFLYPYFLIYEFLV